MPDNVRLTCSCGSSRFRVVVQAGHSYMECQEQGCGLWYHNDNKWRPVPGATIIVPPEYWSGHAPKEKKMEKKPKRWPAALASVVLALGIGTGVLMLNSSDTMEMTLPVYSDNIWEKFSDGYTSEDYDELAKFDYIIMGHETLLSDRHNGLVDSVRARNDDWIYMVYVFIYGCRDGWEENTGFYGDFWRMIDRNDWWLTDWKGDVVHGPCTNPIPDCSVRFLNCGAEGLADSLAWFFSGYMHDRDNVRHHTGVFMDWMTIPFPQWPMRTPTDSLDFNKNGVPACDDPTDAEQVAKYPYQIAKAFREAFKDEPTFLLMPNGNVHYVNGAEYAHLWDGGMYELVNLYYPKGEAQWKRAVVASAGFDNSRVNPPMLMFQCGEEDSSGGPTEALASIANGSCNFQFRNLERRLNLGTRATDPIWSGDTVSAVFVNDEGKQLVARAVSGPFVWPYLITSFDGADTLSRGGGWPAEVPPTELYLVLDDFNNYLTFHMGEPISLSTISYWAGTTQDIIKACDQ